MDCRVKPGNDDKETYGHFTSGGIDDRIESTLPPVFSPTGYRSSCGTPGNFPSGCGRWLTPADTE
jgi:hypothetical protein